eukprot:TRINITY_DN10983_c0_g1_i3.p1 TRINITY_DN10983_c0_g1~~TRINITY_DN10983_c0_g1_i3.p1  ORF type:complete len:183 (-),score=40.87 TRINITY_DN10983_c0_g1_i3:289-837(-)
MVHGSFDVGDVDIRILGVVQDLKDLMRSEYLKTISLMKTVKIKSYTGKVTLIKATKDDTHLILEAVVSTQSTGGDVDIRILGVVQDLKDLMRSEYLKTISLMKTVKIKSYTGKVTLIKATKDDTHLILDEDGKAQRRILLNDWRNGWTDVLTNLEVHPMDVTHAGFFDLSNIDNVLSELNLI